MPLTTPTTTTNNTELPDTATLRHQFEEMGYVMVKSALSPQRVSKVRGEMEALFEQGLVHRKPIAGLDTSGANYKAIIHDLFVHHPSLFDTFCNEKLMTALTAILGKNFVLIPETTGHWGYFNDWHTDVTSPESRGLQNHLHPDYRMVTIGLYLQDNNEFGGGISVVPGSHLAPDPYVNIRHQISKVKNSPRRRWLKRLSFNQLYNPEKRLKHHPQGIDLPSTAGDIIVFDMRLIHRSTYSKTKKKPPYNGKLAIFSRASANNPHYQPYIDYLNYDYLKKPRELKALQAQATPHGFQVL